MKKDATPNRAVKAPSCGSEVNHKMWRNYCRLTRKNIHDHPGFPPVPSIFIIAAANSPENAPGRVLSAIKQSSEASRAYLPTR